MNKLWIIVKREYLTRVTKKTFILATILTPIGIGLIGLVSGYFASQAGKSVKNIVIKDESGILNEDILSSTFLQFTFSEKEIDELRRNYINDGFDIVLHMKKQTLIPGQKVLIQYYAKDKLSLPTLESIERSLSGAIRSFKIEQSGIDKDALAALDTKVDLENALSSGDVDDGEAAGSKASKYSTIISTILSYVMGFLMYMVIFIFGSMVMRSVMEEKVNRIVEVIISSVKPFQLMLGKILGVGLVGLTQIAIWLILIPIILMVVVTIFGGTEISQEDMQMASELMAESGGGENQIALFVKEFKALNWWLILPVFIIFFFGGYMIYSSLFAAIGSTISDDLGESQQFMIPIIIPVIIAFVMIPSVFNDPDGPIAVFGSLFPLLSPILMPARLPFDPPLWQVFLSILILVASIIFFVWLAARIYRVGIFMYGKKVTFKELSKWLFYRG
ncbi:MAG TPA: ABC transporter permease [Saprospiraceae bacterium]|nr:ABC transporter permease [Saprospiraceae bacterium]